MIPELKAFNGAVAALTAAGQPFELNTVQIDGVEYRSYASMPQNLGEYFQVMQGHAAKDFAVYLDQRFTYGQGYQHSVEIAAALHDRFGVKKGDRVAILSRNNPQWMMGFIGGLSIGAVVVPMNGWWTTDELDYGFQDSGAKVVIVDRQRAERLAPIVEKYGLQLITVDDCSTLPVAHTPFDELLREYAGAALPQVDVAAEDNATILYTSGTTGHPKGALSSHRGVLSTLYSWALHGTASKVAMPDSETDDRPAYPPAGLVTIPLFHCTGSHSAFMLSLLIGRKMVIMHKWDAEDALRLIEEERITWFNGVPTMSAELQAAATTTSRDVSSLVDIMGGGAARPPEQVKKIAGTFKKSVPGIGYGLTETNALGTVNAGAFYLARPGSAGIVVPAVTQMRVIDINGEELLPGERGELCIKSPANVLGYWNKPEATAESFVDGWFHTGDVAYIDEEGFVFIVDRIKEIIIRGGENISCLEVEAAIYQHPAIAEAAVFGLPDDRLGEIVAAAIVLREGESLDGEQLNQFLGDVLAAFKLPARVFFRDEQLPRIASGKIFKRQLKAEYTAQITSAA
jgi:steroid-24-oyl-CoA synthetase